MIANRPDRTMTPKTIIALVLAAGRLVTLAQTNSISESTNSPPAVSSEDPIPFLQIDAGKVTGKVSPRLYGLMTEEINFSYEGGLYAELIRNRTFKAQV